MDAAWDITICQQIDGEWRVCEPVNIGSGRTSVSPDFYVLASGPRRLRFDVRCQFYSLFRAAIAWQGWFAFGFCDRATLWREDGARVEIPLGMYFRDFRITDEGLLILSGEGICLLRSDGSVVWHNEALALDGVTINEVADGVISGDGEWDPPGGWRPFRISLVTGQPVP